MYLILVTFDKMTDITTYPLEDWFETELSQARDWAVWTIYVNATPSFTFPAGVTTYIIVDPGKSTMQLAEIDDYDPDLKTIDVSSISVNKWAGVAYTQQSHQIGAKVRISHNYQFWKDIVDAVNTKVNTNDDDIAQGKFADATARDAYFTAPVNGNSAYLTSEGKWTDYVAWAWADRASGTNPNASTTVAGRVEIATEAEGIAWTATGGTGASLDLTPDLIAKITQSWSWLYCASSTGSDTYTANLTPSLTAYTTGMLLPCKFTTTNTGACSININSLGAKSIKTLDGNDPQTWVIRANWTALLMYDGTNFVIQSEDFATTSNKWIQEMCTDAEALAGTDETRYINSKQAKDNYLMLVNVVTGSRNWAWNESIAHWLAKTPKIVYAYWGSANYIWHWFYWDWAQRWSWTANAWRWYSSSYMIFTNWANDAQVTSIDSTNLNVTRTDLWEWTFYSLVFMA